ncbi:MAG: asparagine synthase (glutamine-hydrolyzing) [Candidatus Omnitrophota bacterium]
MCGICGIIDYGRESNLGPGLINGMCAKMTHRGPDEGGAYVENNAYPAVGLGHRRLKIIDLSGSARQPMCNEDKKIWIVFNGEIYNFKELKEGLLERGHKFISHSDTEVIIHLYEEEGRDCVKKLRGMFAFAIWDSNNKQLFLARDRLGKKPLLYSYKNGVFSFASEFMSLIASGNMSRDINLHTIPDYLTYGYIPAPESIYQDVHKLLPGHTLLLKDKIVDIERYWQLDYTKKNNIPFQEAARQAGDMLKEAVSIRLYSDVPLGAFLSGGIDSSTVVGLMAGLSSGKKVKTFSIGFNDKDFDELKYAKIIAQSFDTEHREFIVKPNAVDILPELVERYGEPYSDSSCIPTYYVAKMTRQYVTVALNGDGGDELFAGYERYRAIYLSRWYSRTPFLLRSRFIEPIINGIPHYPHTKNKMSRLKRFIRGASLSLPKRYLRWVSVCDTDFQNRLYSQEFKNSLSNSNPERLLLPFFNHSEGQELIDMLLCADTNTYLPNDLLVKMDIATMANSLEARSPFLDHRLIEFVVSLKADFKMRWFIKKYLLKNIIKDFIPSKIISRPKMGFGVPVGSWFRNDLKDLLTGTLLSQRCLRRGYFNKEFIQWIVKQHLEEKADYTYQLWALLMLELWHNRFIDNHA